MEESRIDRPIKMSPTIQRFCFMGVLPRKGRTLKEETMVDEKTEVVEQVVEPSAPIVDIASLQATLSKLETELEQTKKGLSTAHQTLTQKDRELKTQSDLREEIRGLREDYEILAVGIATRGEEENLDGTKRPDILAELQKRRAIADSNRKAQEASLLAQEYNQKADNIYAQAQTLFEGEDLKDIEDLLKSGNLVMAQREVRKASKGKSTLTKELPKETDDERIEKRVQEELRRRGLLTSDDGITGGGKHLSVTNAMEKYSKGEITADEAAKFGVKFD